MSVFSISSSLILRSSPPAYPVRLPFVPTTRWHGTMMLMGLCPTAPPTACADMRPAFSRFASAPYVWGAGTKPALYPFTERTHKKGAMISAVDLLKGIAVGTSMKVITVDGANGGLDTNYEGKANAALDVLTKDGYDFVYVHLEGPDEMGHQGSVEKKVKAIERLDERIIRPIAEGLAAAGEDFRMVVLPDHPTPISLRTHTADNVPYLLYDSTAERSESWHYNEREAAQTTNFIPEGHKLIEYLLQM